MANYQSSAGPIARGDAFLVQTPQTDQAINELQAEQARREAFAQRESLALDSQMSKEFANVRNVDAPDVINSYNQYKNIKKQIYFNPKVQNDPAALAKLNQQANEALGNTWASIDKSREMKQTLQDLNKVYGTHPERFIDGFPQAHQQLQATPTNKLQNFNINSLYDETPNADIAKIITTAQGKAVPRSSSDTPFGTAGVQTTRTHFNYTAPPQQVAESLINQFHAGKSGKYAVQAWKELSPEEIAKTDQEYETTSPEKWNRTTGSQNKQQLPEYNPNNPAANYGIYLAKKLFNTSDANPGKIETITDQAKLGQLKQADRLAIQKNTFRHQDWMQGISQGGMNSRQQLARDWQLMDDETKTESIPAGFTAQLQTAMSTQERPLVVPAGSGTVSGYTFEPITAVKKEFQYKDEKGHYQDPDEMLIKPDENGKPIITGLFYKEVDGKKINEVDPDKTKQIRADDPQLTSAVRKDLMGVPKTSAGVSGKGTGNNSSTSYNVKGKTYTHKQLNDMGYTDDQINSAIQSGTIKK